MSILRLLEILADFEKSTDLIFWVFLEMGFCKRFGDYSVFCEEGEG